MVVPQNTSLLSCQFVSDASQCFDEGVGGWSVPVTGIFLSQTSLNSGKWWNIKLYRLIEIDCLQAKATRPCGYQATVMCNEGTHPCSNFAYEARPDRALDTELKLDFCQVVFHHFSALLCIMLTLTCF